MARTEQEQSKLDVRVQEVVSSIVPGLSSGIKGKFKVVYEALGQKSDPNIDALSQGGASELAQRLVVGFVESYFDLTGGRLPKDEQISEFVSFAAGPSLITEHITGQSSYTAVKSGIATPYVRSNFSKFVKEEKTPEEIAEADKEAKRQADQIALAKEQRGESGALFQQSLDALKSQIPTFAGGYTPEALQHIIEQLTKAGITQRSTVEAEQAERGLTGSSIEAAALSQSGESLINAIKNSTFDFLMRSGEQGVRQRETLAQGLMQQAQALLGAGQQTEGLVTGREMQSQQQQLAARQLQAQIAQFNQQLQASRQQFEAQQLQKQQEIQQSLALFNQYMNRGGRGAPPLGTVFAPTATGAVAGAPFGPIGVGVGAGVGLGTGIYDYLTYNKDR